MSEQPYIMMTDEEAREAVDRACIKLFGKSYRPDDQDSLAQIEHDFPSIFGGNEKA